MHAATLTLVFLLYAVSLIDVTCATSRSSSSSVFGRPTADDDDILRKKREDEFRESGRREFKRFVARRGDSEFSSATTKHTSSSSSSSSASQSRNNRRRPPPDVIFPRANSVVQRFRKWWATFPHELHARYGPTYSLKLRKTFHPFGTTVKIGADFQNELGTWRPRASLEEDPILHGHLSYKGGELRFTKSWSVPANMGAFNNDDMVTLRLRCAVDTQTGKAYARLGFRTEQLTPLNFMEGFPYCHRVPLNGGNISLEVKSTVMLPQPEIEVSTEIHNKRHFLWAGMGDVDVNVEEVNALIDL